MAATLKAAGFEVVDLKRDLKVSEMRRALRDFSDSASGADIAVVYYAGHGMEIDGTNYIIPTDAVLQRDIDAFDEAIPLDRLLTVVEPAKQLRLVILDACRDNPFNKTMKRTIGSRAIGRGLARVEPGSPNTLVAFAAKAGSTASDGDSKNSPYTTALAKFLPKPGLDLRKALGFTRDEVLKVTNNRQEPFVYGSLGGNDVSLVPAIAAPVATGPAASGNDALVQRAYELALQVGNKAVWDTFIAKYPSGLYTELAKAQRDKVVSEAARLAATEKAKAAQEEQTRLAVEGAKKAELEKAAAEAKKAEQQRIAAELAKKAEEAKVAEAEKAKAAEEARNAADKRTSVASLTPDQSAPRIDAPIAVADIPRQLQIELRRVGCNTGSVSEIWTPGAQKAMELFNKSAGMRLDVKVASLDSLDIVKSKASRICPLACEQGYQPDGDRCTQIICKSGYEVGSGNACEKIEVRKPAPPVARQERTAPTRRAASSGGGAPSAAAPMDCNGPMGFANCVAHNLAKDRH